MRVSLFTLSLVALATPFAASAQSRNAPTLIAAGDYRAAEQVLDADRKIFPQEPELLLNLAAVYQYTNRGTQARALYQDILAQPNVLMDLSAERTAWSHEVAQNGLRRLAGVQMSSR